jgi:hypothetical protein
MVDPILEKLVVLRNLHWDLQLIYTYARIILSKALISDFYII